MMLATPTARAGGRVSIVEAAARMIIVRREARCRGRCVNAVVAAAAPTSLTSTASRPRWSSWRLAHNGLNRVKSAVAVILTSSSMVSLRPSAEKCLPGALYV